MARKQRYDDRPVTMTEDFWLSFDDPKPNILGTVRTMVSERKWKLLAVAYCRRIQHLFYDTELCGHDIRLWDYVDFLENFADAKVEEAEFSKVYDVLSEIVAFSWAERIQSQQLSHDNRPTDAAHMTHSCAHAVQLAFHVARPTLTITGTTNQLAKFRSRCTASVGYYCVEAAIAASRAIAGPEVSRRAIWAETGSLERANQSNLAREIIGNPFHSHKSDRSKCPQSVMAFAQLIYDEKRFEDTPILADALEETGYCDQNLLDHFRNSGKHVKGCWGLDLLLGLK